MKMRRAVTGHDDRGKAVFVGDEQVEATSVALLPGVEFLRMWGCDEAPQFPDTGGMPEARLYFPPLGGWRFGFFALHPGGAGGPHGDDVGAALNELEAKLPGLAQALGRSGVSGLRHRLSPIRALLQARGRVRSAGHAVVP